VAVLLDEFIKAVVQEKQILTQAGMDDASHALDHKGPLDRFLAPLTHFNDLEDLRNKISALFHFFDTNDSGLLTKVVVVVEVIHGLQNSSGIILSDEDCDDIGLNDQEKNGGVHSES
jgi:Ca2+-binding EF-hand superfamily protein